jgi:hypothetical protein
VDLSLHLQSPCKKGERQLVMTKTIVRHTNRRQGKRISIRILNLAGNGEIGA